MVFPLSIPLSATFLLCYVTFPFKTDLFIERTQFNFCHNIFLDNKWILDVRKASWLVWNFSVPPTIKTLFFTDNTTVCGSWVLCQSMPTKVIFLLGVSVSFKFYQLVKYLTNFWQYKNFEWSSKVIRIQDPYVSFTIELHLYILFHFSKMFTLCICIFVLQYKFCLTAQLILVEKQKFKYFLEKGTKRENLEISYVHNPNEISRLKTCIHTGWS